MWTTRAIDNENEVWNLDYKIECRLVVEKTIDSFSHYLGNSNPKPRKRVGGFI